jgi:hypothetical protein
MNQNPMCAACAKDCKQPRSVTMVSCPAFDKADKNLDMFDMKGNVREKLINPAANKKPRAK